MRRPWVFGLLLAGLCGLCPLLAQQEEAPSGDLLMQTVRAQLPRQHIRMSGLIRTRREGRDTDRRLISELRFGAAVPAAEYRLFDALGAPLTRVQVQWTAGGPQWFQWNAQAEALPPPRPDDEVADTGLTWSDLSLSFLWWPGAEVVDTDRVKTRSTWVVRLPAPEERSDVDHIRLWVDKKACFIVKAELLDAEGSLLKRIEVDSIKEIRKDVWMVKDVLIRDKQNGIRMGIRFEEVEELEETDA